jgi:hypothetical protein
MRSSISRIAAALVFAFGCWSAAGCAGDDGGGAAGGTGGTGGAGASGGSGAITDAAGGTAGGTVGCVTEAPTACPNPPVNYSDVAPIFQKRCVDACHNDRTPDPNNLNTPIWGFTDFEHVVTWKATIRAEVFACSMPPPDAGIPVTIEERRAILEFLRCLPQ